MALESLKLKQISGFGDDAGIVTVQLCVVIVVVVVLLLLLCCFCCCGTIYHSC